MSHDAPASGFSGQLPSVIGGSDAAARRRMTGGYPSNLRESVTVAQTTKDKPKGASGYKEYSAPHADLREWLDRTEALGELQKIDGADWNLEIGAVAEMIYHATPDSPPAILFDNIPGYPKGFRVLSGLTASANRLAIDPVALRQHRPDPRERRPRRRCRHLQVPGSLPA
jgi:hypothetical protein